MAQASSLASAQEHIRSKSPLLAQASSTKIRHEGQLSDHSVKQSHIFGCALSSPTNGLSSQSTCEPGLPLLPSFPGYQMTGNDFIISSRMADIPNPSPFGSTSIPTVDGPVQLDRLFHQMQTTRQDETLNRNVTIRFDPCNGVALPLPFVSCNSLNLNGGLQVPRTQTVRNPVSILS